MYSFGYDVRTVSFAHHNCAFCLPESAQAVWESFGQRSARGPGLQRNADDRRAAATVQPGSTDDHVPHPRVQVVPDAPAPAHRSALRPGIRLARLEKVSAYSVPISSILM